MTFQHRIAILFEHDPRHLRGEKALQARQFFDFIDLVADTLLEALVERRELAGLPRQYPGL